MLAVASIIDIKNREVPDMLWIVFGVVAVVMIFFEDDMIESLTLIAFSMILAPFVLLIWRFGFFGGADALSLIVLAGLAPLATLDTNVVTPFTTFSNAVLFMTLLVPINLVRNVFAMLSHENIFYGFKESKFRKMIAMFFGFRSKNPKFSFSIERMEGSHKKFDFSLHHADTEPFCNSPKTWVTPGVPLILFITVGFVIQILFGDIILAIFGF
ncbi:peptidase [Nitrosopumilus ureiphilus]|uniref:Peptidase n=2 Tax=Nitrosopumilus ureiphilus TaxID=1470067 RepID=A0A7D5M8R9_9ARCH|nr:peptidase [Nitrosopumilus ureiphilus]